jgi:hypothetical protein
MPGRDRLELAAGGIAGAGRTIGARWLPPSPIRKDLDRSTVMKIR